MNTAEVKVAVSAATMLNMAQVAVDVARRVSGRESADDLRARSTFVLLKDDGVMSSEFLGSDITSPADPETNKMLDMTNDESTIPYQIAADLMARQITSMVKFK